MLFEQSTMGDLIYVVPEASEIVHEIDEELVKVAGPGITLR